MAFTDIELARHKRSLGAWIEKNRPPPHIRPKLDFGYRITGQSVELFEIRPAFQRPGEKHEGSIAKATWNKRQRIWQVYWQRADLKWHRAIATTIGGRIVHSAVSHPCATPWQNPPQPLLLNDSKKRGRFT
ncbi:MAG: DUF3024 domain-containing protein [Nevskiaceae bacterium]